MTKPDGHKFPPQKVIPVPHHPIPEPLLTIAEVARVLNQSEKTVRRRIARGELTVFRDGRIIRVRPIDVRTYIAQRTGT
jgi:excisionase family DNA binding protein